MRANNILILGIVGLAAYFLLTRKAAAAPVPRYVPSQGQTPGFTLPVMPAYQPQPISYPAFPGPTPMSTVYKDGQFVTVPTSSLPAPSTNPPPPVYPGSSVQSDPAFTIFGNQPLLTEY